jgi:hypothetical protein
MSERGEFEMSADINDLPTAKACDEHSAMLEKDQAPALVEVEPINATSRKGGIVLVDIDQTERLGVLEAVETPSQLHSWSR